ncbi:aldehyde-activating protein [Devosia pacifica]|uniref:Aldehyde-activating protein n=1 Tax=Devosia pacifica TaxID=1335967 RepID=A0A918VV34_9HYPH|nr:GFA family protein [Devosia pacifica]GHA25896.1 aldehyde-activating protein [Devosia pacifica]
MSNGAEHLTGQCTCGTVRFSVEDGFEYSAYCHCKDCQRTTGSAFKPFAGIAREAFAVVAGGDGLTFRGDNEAHDARCSACGSLIYSLVRDGAYVHIPLGTLDRAPKIRPSEHIFVASKAAWYEINDDLPQYAGHVADGPPLNR